MLREWGNANPFICYRVKVQNLVTSPHSYSTRNAPEHIVIDLIVEFKAFVVCVLLEEFEPFSCAFGRVSKGATIPQPKTKALYYEGKSEAPSPQLVASLIGGLASDIGKSKTLKY